MRCSGFSSLQVLALPGLVWKQLTGEAVSWSKDFPAVDSVLVRTFRLSHLHNMLWNTYFRLWRRSFMHVQDCRSQIRLMKIVSFVPHLKIIFCVN